MLTTKEFADLCDTTKRTIIYYDRIDLLKPLKRKDNFRLYSPHQVLTFQKIILLKSFHLTLFQIKDCLNKTSGLKDIFNKQYSDLNNNMTVLEKRIVKLQEFISNLENNKPLIVPAIKIVKPYSFYALLKTGRYVDIAKHQRELFNLLGDKSYHSVGLTVFLTRGYAPDQSRMESASMISVKNPKAIKGVKIVMVPQHKTVSYIHIGPYSYMSYIWQFLDKFISENKLKIHPNLSAREFYLLGGLREKNKDNLITELQIPIL